MQIWQTALLIYSLAFFIGVVVRFRKLKTHTNAPQRHNTLQTMAIEVGEGQTAAARQIAQGAAASSRVFCACVRAGENLRPNLETTFGEEILCPDLRLRSGRNTPFWWIFRSWKIVRTNIRLHLQCTQI